MSLGDATRDLREAVIDLAADLRWVEQEGGDPAAALLSVVDELALSVPERVLAILRRCAPGPVLPPNPPRAP